MKLALIAIMLSTPPVVPGQSTPASPLWDHNAIMDDLGISEERDVFVAHTEPRPPFHEAELLLGIHRGTACLVDEVDVNYKVVETRSCDLKHVHYATGWNAKRIDAVLRFLVNGKNLAGMAR